MRCWTMCPLTSPSKPQDGCIHCVEPSFSSPVTCIQIFPRTNACFSVWGVLQVAEPCAGIALRTMTAMAAQSSRFVDICTKMLYMSLISASFATSQGSKRTVSIRREPCCSEERQTRAVVHQRLKRNAPHAGSLFVQIVHIVLLSAGLRTVLVQGRPNPQSTASMCAVLPLLVIPVMILGLPIRFLSGTRERDKCRADIGPIIEEERPHFP